MSLEGNVTATQVLRGKINSMLKSEEIDQMMAEIREEFDKEVAEADKAVAKLNETTKDLEAAEEEYDVLVARVEQVSNEAETACANAGEAGQYARQAAEECYAAANCAIRCDEAQTLTDEQKAQARDNIDAVSADVTEQEKNGNNLLDPANTESGYYESAVGAALIAYNSSNHQRTIEPIPLDDINTNLYFYSDGLPTDYNWIAAINFVDGNGNLTGTESFSPTSTYNYTVPSWYGKPVAMHVWVSGVNSGASLSKVCLSTTKLDAFEPYQEPKTVIKKDALSQEALKNFAPLYGKTIVNFGDSIFGNTRPPKDISTELAKLTGATVHNCGFGGCRMAEHSQSNFDAFSMYRLSYAIASGNFTAQETALAVTENAVPTYFAETLALLKSIDFNDVDIITIAYGTNDFTGGVSVDDEAGNMTTSFGGALRTSIETLLFAHPHLKIFICSPIYRFWTDNGKDSDEYTPRSDGAMLSAFVEKGAEIAKEYHLPFFNNYDGLGFNKVNRLYYFPANDGTHPNWKGNCLIAEHMAKELF